MKHALALVLLLLFSAPGALLAQQPLVMCTTESAPLSTPEQTGMLDTIVAEAFRRAGAAIKILTVPGERALLNANSGAADGDINRIAGLDAQYVNLVQVPEPNMTYDFVAISRKPMVINGWDSLRPYRVGYVIGWKILERNVVAKSVTKVATGRQLFALLAAGRVDVVIYERWTGEHLLRELNVTGAKVLDPPLERRQMYIYLHTRHAPLVPKLAAALRAMKADGAYSAIVSRYKKQ